VIYGLWFIYLLSARPDLACLFYAVARFAFSAVSGGEGCALTGHCLIVLAGLVGVDCVVVGM